MMQLTEEQRKALAVEIVEQLVDCGSADDVAVERYVGWVFKRLSTITQPVVAPVVPDFSECPLCDSNYISGMQAGYKFGAEQDRAGFNAAVEHYRKEMRVRRALRVNATAPAINLAELVPDSNVENSLNKLKKGYFNRWVKEYSSPEAKSGYVAGSINVKDIVAVFNYADACAAILSKIEEANK